MLRTAPNIGSLKQRYGVAHLRPENRRKGNVLWLQGELRSYGAPQLQIGLAGDSGELASIQVSLVSPSRAFRLRVVRGTCEYGNRSYLRRSVLRRPVRYTPGPKPWRTDDCRARWSRRPTFDPGCLLHRSRPSSSPARAIVVAAGPKAVPPNHTAIASATE